MSDPVLNILNTNNITFTISGKDYLIKCLNPEHEDNNPSCRVDKLTGITHCLACGWSANIFRHFGIFTDFTSIKIMRLKKKMKDLQEQVLGITLPVSAIPFNRNFRNISAATFKAFNAFHTTEEKDWEDRIVFPITDVSGKIVCLHGRHTLSDAKPKYLTLPGGTTIPLFPNKLPEYSNSIILVEGIFDMLNLYDKGIHNAVCVFGTDRLKRDAANKLLAYKVQGITKIFILFDGDKAGRVAAAELKLILEEIGYETIAIDLPEGEDPGNLTAEDVLSIKEYIK